MCIYNYTYMRGKPKALHHNMKKLELSYEGTKVEKT